VRGTPYNGFNNAKTKESTYLADNEEEYLTPDEGTEAQEEKLLNEKLYLALRLSYADKL
jgi:hypothetical protein